MRTAIFFLLLAAVCPAAPPPAARLDPGKAGMDPARLAQIPLRMKDFVDQGTIAGSVTLVMRHGAVAALDAVGYRDFESKIPMRPDHIFQIHSQTKPIVAAAAMILVEEGKISLSDPVERHLPEFRGQWVVDSRSPDGKTISVRRPARKVIIRDLMTHTSGMSTNPPPPIGELHRKLHLPLAEVVAIASQQPLDFDPGTKFLYSNMGIAALARIIEVAGGIPFEKFMEERVFKPLGMTDTAFAPAKSKYDRVTGSYILENGKTLKYTADPLGEGVLKYRDGAKYPLPEGGIYSTAADLGAFHQMMLNSGFYNSIRLLSKASVEVMTRNHTGNIRTSGAGAGWGLGFSVVRDASGTLGMQSVGTYSHGGRYGTYGWVDPKRDLVGIFLIQREGGSDERNAFVEMVNSAIVE